MSKRSKNQKDSILIRKIYVVLEAIDTHKQTEIGFNRNKKQTYNNVIFQKKLNELIEKL